MDGQDYFHYSYLEDLNFERKKCSSCGSDFWTLDRERKTCGDSPCDSYGFIGNPPVKQEFDHRQMRELFISFFRDTHEFVEPYPIVPRWRDDVLLVNASIYDFQPHVTSGLADPPGNPLVMSQPSIRMVDLDNVGKTGRHLTTFEMMCHDAFNTRGREVYWKNETVEYCHRFLTEKVGIEGSLVTYKEKPWSGGGNGGEAVEVFVKGLEVATLVFMDMEIDPSGEYEIDGEHYSKMENRIIDTGYGLERLSWLTDGKQSVYESLYPEMLDYIFQRIDLEPLRNNEISFLASISSENENLSESQIFSELAGRLGIPVEKHDELKSRYLSYRNAAIIADHTKTIMLLLNDKVVPSNVKVGYILRMLIRRTLRSMKSVGLESDIYDLVEMQRSKFHEICEHFDSDFARLMLAEETRKNEEVVRTGTQMVSRLIDRNKVLTEDDLVKLYDSNGLDPDTVVEIYSSKTGRELEVPDDFHARVIALHTSVQKKEKKESFPQFVTRPLYYDDVGIREFTGIVLYSKDGKVILNQTAFYPEGGGQPPDHGYLQRGHKKYNVSYVEKSGTSIVHHVDGNPDLKARIKGYIDYDRRWQFMIHHSATHLLLAVTREILGSHVWQTGVQKGIDTSRIDLVHYARITDEEIARIEGRCLEIIEQDRKITVRNLDWNLALKKHGFTLFQGGVPLDSRIRVVEIDGIDAEGCGGTHLHSTGPIGMLKIVSADSLQEGIQRITFIAGPALLRYTQKMHSTLTFSRNVLKTDMQNFPSAVNSLVDENRAMHKEIEREEKRRVQAAVENSETVKIGNLKVRIVRHSLGPDAAKLLMKVVTSQLSDLAIVIDGSAQETSVISGGKIDSSAFLKKIAGPDVTISSGSKRFSKVSVIVEITESLIRSALV